MSATAVGQPNALQFCRVYLRYYPVCVTESAVLISLDIDGQFAFELILGVCIRELSDEYVVEDESVSLTVCPTLGVGHSRSQFVDILVSDLE